jgi:heme/copper-type cytochrome/quinol oxidase subunit 4
MSTSTVHTDDIIQKDAEVRGWRSFMQGLGIDVVVAITVFLVTVIADLEWTRTYWIMVGLGLARSVVQGIVAYFARKFIKPSNAPF